MAGQRHHRDPARRHRRRRGDSWSAGRIALIYALVAALWILLSDQALEAMLPNGGLRQHTAFQTGKGLFFITATAVIVWALVLRRLRYVRRVEGERTAIEDRLATFADNLPGVAFIKDADGRFVFIRGESAEGATPPEELVGKTSREVLGPDSYERVAAHDRTVLETGKGSQLVETFHFGPNVRHYLVHRFPLTGPNGERWVGGVSLDVTERQIAEAKIRELARELEDANRLKDQFLSNLSHELRTPMTAIGLWLEVLKSSGAADPDGFREAVGMIQSSAASQLQLIEDLLDMTRIAAGKLKIDLRPTALAEVVGRTVGLLGPMAREREVAVELSLPPGERAPVLGDAKRLQQVVWNLLSNAIKFSSPGGRVRVSLGQDGQQWVLAVADEGIGIGPDLLPRLFERFRQADSSRTRAEGGVGIGLSLVKYMADAHGGGAAAASDGEGKGATFTVRLPVADAAALPPPGPVQAAPALPAPPLAGKKVLLVEDNADSRTGMTLLLGRAGAAVKAVDDVDSALEVDGEFDLLLSDIGLPDRDGTELVAELRRRPAWRDKPALAISAYAQAEDKERAIRAGFDAFLVKPIDPDGAIATIVEWVERKGNGGQDPRAAHG